MSTLHLLNESPYKGTSLTSALLFATLDDALLLTGDAVYALQKNTAPYQLLAKSHLYLCYKKICKPAIWKTH